MTRKSASQSPFLGLRVLLGLVLFVVSVVLALLAFGTFSNALAEASRQAQFPAQQSGILTTQEPIEPASVCVVDFKKLAEKRGKTANALLRDQPPVITPFPRLEVSPLTPSPGTITAKDNIAVMQQSAAIPAPSAALPNAIFSAATPTATPISISFQPVLSLTAQEAVIHGPGFLVFVVPPDTMGAVGPDKLFTTLNTNYRVQDKNTGAVLSEMSGRDFWASVPGVTYTGGSFLVFDPYNARWLIAGLGKTDLSLPTDDRILVGVSSTSDPEGEWTLLSFDSFDVGLPDLPLLGFNKNWVVVGYNELSSTRSFIRGRLLIIDYPALRAGSTISVIQPVNGSGNIHVHPAITLDPTEETLFIPAQVNGVSAQYMLHKIIGTPSSPVFTPDSTLHTRPGGGWSGAGGDILPQSSCGITGMPGVTCPTIPRFINAPSDYLTSDVIFRNGNIWYSQTIGLPAGAVTHTAAQWTRIDKTGTFIDGGRVEDPTANSSNGGEWYAYPSIAVNANEDVLLGFSQFSSTHFANAGYAFRFGSDSPGTIRTPIFVKQGEDYYSRDPDANVWGFYSNTSVDPANDLDMWTIQEYAGTRTVQDAQQTSENSHWATWWAKVCGSRSPCIIGGDVSASATVGQQFFYQISATNYPTLYDATLPPDLGLTVDPSLGIIFGIPTVAIPNLPISVSATNSFGTGSANNLTLSVQPAPPGPQIVSSTTATGRTGQPFRFRVLTVGTTSSAQLSIDPDQPLPPGLALVNGLISGTPTADGNFRVTLILSDGGVTITSTLQLTFTNDPAVPVIGSGDTGVAQGAVESSAIPSPVFGSTDITLAPGQSINYVIPTGAVPTRFGPILGLPLGLQFDPTTGTIFGTYTGGGVGDQSGVHANRSSDAGMLAGSFVSPKSIRIIRPPGAICQAYAINDSGTGTAPINFVFTDDAVHVSNDMPDLVEEATGPNGAAVTFIPFTATDYYANNLPVTCDPSSGSIFPLGATLVSCASAANSFGSYAVVSFGVTVQDTTAPVITEIPASVTVSKQKVVKGQPPGAFVSFANQLVATDLVDGNVTPSASPASGSFFPLGTTVVTVTATDSHGNSSAPQTFTVNVVNKVPKAKAATIHVSANPTSINQGQSATFAISVTSSNPSQAITVNYSTTCSATPASDFYTLTDHNGGNLGLSSGSVTIPSGAASATVTLNALTNSLSTGSETVTLTLSGGSGYKLSPVKKNKPNPNQATVTINNGP